MSEIFFPMQLQQVNFLSSGCNLNGTFNFTGMVRVLAFLEGKVFIEDGVLILEREGRIRGEIVGKNIEIYGHIEGKITASERVILWPSANVTGSIQTEKLVVYPGAVLNIDGQVGSVGSVEAGAAATL